MNPSQQTKQIKALVSRMQETIPTVHTDRYGVTTIDPVYHRQATVERLTGAGYVISGGAGRTLEVAR